MAAVEAVKGVDTKGSAAVVLRQERYLGEVRFL